MEGKPSTVVSFLPEDIEKYRVYFSSEDVPNDDKKIADKSNSDDTDCCICFC